MGKKHMLTILSVLFSSADVIILDEPTLGMDGFLIKELADMIKKLSAEGKTVIMISHEIPLVFKTVDEAIILNQGEKIFEGSKESLARRDDIFDHINIQLPPVVLLSKALGLDEICYSVEEFAAKIVERNV